MNRLTAQPLPAKGPLGRSTTSLLRPPGAPPLRGGYMPGEVPQAGPQQPPPVPPSHDQIMDAIKQVHYLNDGLRALLNKPGGPTRSDVIDEAGHLISEGVMSSQAAAQELQSLPDDTAGITAWLQAHIMKSTVTRGRLFDMIGGGQQGGQGGPGGQGGQQQSPQPQGDPPSMQNALTAGMSQNG